ncbi:MAG: NAD(P)/FAD-dependent oxidoreductase, partial [Spirochaetota bacterium]
MSGQGDVGADADAIVIGAGSVGLFLSLLLARRGLSVLLLEKRRERSPHSRAIGISSPSLGILDSLGLADALISRGVPVRAARISDGRRELGRLDFAELGGPFPFVLALPQAVTEAWLEGLVLAEPGVRLLKGCEVVSLRDNGALAEASGRTDGGGAFRFASGLVIACDGARSALRDGAGFGLHGHAYRDSFLMGDYADLTDWGDEARLFFTPRGSVESFPLPGGQRRWVLSTPHPMQACEGDWLAVEVGRRTGSALDPATRKWESAFGVERRMARRWASGRVFLAGDAAHLMSPIVGQNMNTGFADAEHLAAALPGLLHGGRSPTAEELSQLGASYTRARS